MGNLHRISIDKFGEIDIKYCKLSVFEYYMKEKYAIFLHNLSSTLILHEICLLSRFDVKF